MVTFDGDQTLYSDGANFDSNPKLAAALSLLLKNGTSVAIVTAAGYGYETERYTMRISGLLTYFREHGVTPEMCGNFYLFGGEFFPSFLLSSARAMYRNVSTFSLPSLNRHSPSLPPFPPSLPILS